MNMKKTIAAIAAGAVAVSAMATTVSAVESKTLNYNLTATLANQNNGKVTLKATFPNVQLQTGKNVKIRVLSNSSNGWNDKIVIGGQYIDTNKAINPITFTHDEWAEGFSKTTADMMSSAAQANANAGWMDFVFNGPAGSYGHEITIPVLPGNTGAPAFIGGSSLISSVATATCTGVSVAATNDTITEATVDATAFLGLAAGTYNVIYTGSESYEGWKLQDGNGNATGIQVNVSNIKNAGGNAVAMDDADKWSVALPVTYAPASGTNPANITVTATLNNLTAGNNGDMGGAISAGKFAISISLDDGATWARGDAAYSGLTAATKYKMPFRTTLNDNVNIIDYLETANLIGDDKHYVNVKAVLNDAISAYEGGVTFTFNTAVGKVKYALAEGNKAGNPTIASDLFTTYDAAVKAASGSQWVTAVYNEDWDAVDTYTQFGEHTYNWFYAPETTGYTGYDWGGTNLFAGALVINEAYTMSLSNTEYFDWTKTSLSFDWEAIMDNAATTNNYATYVHSLKLATSNMWFWDSMDVVLNADAVDTVGADAGTEVDDETLGDDEDDGEVIGDDDDDTDVAPADDDDDVDVAPVEDAPAPVVTNPPTGNASVALAVIPVALAAAAIVAKKRG